MGCYLPAKAIHFARQHLAALLLLLLLEYLHSLLESLKPGLSPPKPGR